MVVVMVKTVKVAITVCTRGRPEYLQACLTSLIRQELPDDVIPTIVVIENGEPLGVCEFVDVFSNSLPRPWKILYENEPNLGIPQARNRSLLLALEQQPDWIAFIDDDETVDVDWLARMVAITREFDADVFRGPIRYVYPEVKPEWYPINRPRPFKRGQNLKIAYTNNTLVRAALISSEGLALRFDENMRFTGGSDAEFFLRAVEFGAAIRYVDDAWVQEVVTPNRLTKSWLFNRNLRNSSNSWRIRRNRFGYLSAFIRFVPKAISRVGRGAVISMVGFVFLPISSVQGNKIMLNGLKKLSAGLGIFLGMFNRYPQPYSLIEKPTRGSNLDLTHNH